MPTSALRAAEQYVRAPRFVESHRLAPFNPRGTDVAVESAGIILVRSNPLEVVKIIALSQASYRLEKELGIGER